METPLVREKLTLRVPPELHRRLRHSAVENERSLNAEIVQRLRGSFGASLVATTGTAIIDVGGTPVTEKR